MNDLKACIVQRDRTVLLECAHPGFEAAREKLARFAELVKSPSAFHTYRITPLSLWNAAALGCTAEDIAADLESIARWGLLSGTAAGNPRARLKVRQIDAGKGSGRRRGRAVPDGCRQPASGRSDRVPGIVGTYARPHLAGPSPNFGCREGPP